MTSIFPESKEDFTAANGITYTWAENRWRTKTYDTNEYLPLDGGTVTGPTTFDCPTMVKWDKASSNSYPFSVYGGDKWSFRVGDTGVVKISGTTEMNQPSGTALRIKKDGLDKVKIEHGGRIFCGYDLSLDEDDRTVVTRGYVKEQIAAIPAPEGGGGGGQFIDEFNHGYAAIQGNETAPINNNQIAFLDDTGEATKQFSSIGKVLLPHAFINPEWVTKTGAIKIESEDGLGAPWGYLSVVDMVLNEGKNVTLVVKPAKYGGNNSDISYGKRLTVTFNGVFFGVYDPFWNPDK